MTGTLVTRRLEELAPKIPHDVGAALELSNLCLRLAKRSREERARQRGFEQNTRPEKKTLPPVAPAGAGDGAGLLPQLRIMGVVAVHTSTGPRLTLTTFTM